MQRLIARFPRRVKVLALAATALGLAAGAAVGGAPAVHAQDADASLLPPLCGGKVATIIGTPDNDSLQGTQGPDVIVGLGGHDGIAGGGGDDIICGGGGDDTLFGDLAIFPGESHPVQCQLDPSLNCDGNDLLFGGPGEDHLYGGDGYDLCSPEGGGTTAQCEPIILRP